jgi:nucleotide-binding universal stress UspA family protein
VNRILFPVDFSERCAQAAPAVRAWSETLGAPLALMHVVGLPAAAGGELAGLADVLAASQRAAARALADFAERHFPGLAVETAVTEGEPAAAINAWTRGSGRLLVMMPTHGAGPFRRFLVGSVTARVLHDVACPVWTAAHRPGSGSAPAWVRRILCGVDRDPSAVPLMRFAAQVAQQWGAALELVHVLPSVDETSHNRGEKAVRRYWTTRAQRELEPLLRAAGQSGVRLRGGPLAAALADTARQVRADLLVIGRGRLHKRLGRLRTHTMPIICASPCPVLSL